MRGCAEWRGRTTEPSRGRLRMANQKCGSRSFPHKNPPAKKSYYEKNPFGDRGCAQKAQCNQTKHQKAQKAQRNQAASTDGTGRVRYLKAKRRACEHPQRAGLVPRGRTEHQTKKRRATTDEEPARATRPRRQREITSGSRRATAPRPRPVGTATRRRSRRPPPARRRPPSSPRPVRGLEVARAP